MFRCVTIESKPIGVHRGCSGHIISLHHVWSWMLWASALKMRDAVRSGTGLLGVPCPMPSRGWTAAGTGCKLTAHGLRPEALRLSMYLYAADTSDPFCISVNLRVGCGSAPSEMGQNSEIHVCFTLRAEIEFASCGEKRPTAA